MADRDARALSIPFSTAGDRAAGAEEEQRISEEGGEVSLQNMNDKT